MKSLLSLSLPIATLFRPKHPDAMGLTANTVDAMGQRLVDLSAYLPLTGLAANLKNRLGHADQPCGNNRMGAQQPA